MDHLYLDYCATTPVRPEVLSEMIRVFETEFGNPSSLHERGRAAKKILESARESIACSIGGEPKEIYFTGSGTEANNLAIFGLLSRQKRTGGHVITTQIEHPAVLNCFQELERQGIEVTYLPVSNHGVVQFEDVRHELRKDTRLVSVMLANNEVGTLQPVADIASMCREQGIPIHTDAVQAVGKIPVDVRELQVDMLTCSPHKMYGPKGVGILYVNRRTRLQPILFGGGQERGLRSATENVALIHGSAVAVDLAVRELEIEMPRLRELRDLLQTELLQSVPSVKVTTGGAERLPHVLNVVVADVLGEAILLNLDRLGVHVSAGSACSAGSADPSPVLSAMGVDPRYIHGSVRISLGRYTTNQDIDRFIAAFRSVVTELRRMITI